MKKILALVLVLAVLASVAAGCSDKKSDEGILAAAFSTETLLSLPISAELNNGDFISYGGYQFQNSKKLSKLAEKVTKNNKNINLQTTENAYGKCCLFTSETPTGTESWCLYQLDPANMNKQFVFSGLHRAVATPDGNQEMLLPLHLISDSYIRDSMGSMLALDREYTCGLKGAEETMEQLFRSFYEASGLYTVNTVDGGFTVLPRRGSATLLQFSFSNHDETDWFTLSDATIRDPEPTTSAAVVWTKEGADPVTAALDENDAIQLSTVVIPMRTMLQPVSGELTSDYSIDIGGITYGLNLEWLNNSWGGELIWEHSRATLPAKAGSVLAAVLQKNGLMPIDTETTATVENVIEPIAACMATSTSVNVRTIPSTSGSKVITTLKEDSPVAVVGKLDGWYQILFGDILAYMSADYLRGVSE